MKIVIEFEHGAKRETIEVASADSIETMRWQIYSLTNIPPHEQSWVINAGASSSSSSSPAAAVNNDSAQIRSLGLKEGQRVIVTRKLTEATQMQEEQRKAAQDALAAFAAKMAATPAAMPAATPAATPAAAAAPRPTPASASSASSAYSRATEMSLQGCCSRSFFGPESQVQPGAKSGDKSICFACAQTCHLPRDLKPRPSTSAFVCACAEDHECIFGARSLAAADLLVGLARAQASAALRNAAVQMQEQQLAQGRAEMQARIDMHIKAALEYENPQWQAEARAVIPIDRLRSQAAAAIADGSSQLAPEDELMEQLLRWFKHDFFSWTNSPNCDSCGAGTSAIGADRPNASEAPFRPGRVEIYKCGSGHITRFPRYNHASKLLQTRRGRCGEWAQAFTLCVRAIGIEARAVNDWTDHVWTEYYSEAEKRWIHADSCEARRDAPLLYEAGWGKKLSYIIACSKDELVDVTQRYTKKWNEVLERRTACPEQWLNMHIATLSVMRFASLSPARQSVLSARRDVELAEFARNVREDIESRKPAVKPEEMQGRTTGSLEWRAARGELGANAVAVERALNPESAASSSSSSAAPTSAAATSSSAGSAASAVFCKTDDSKAQCSTNPVGAAAASATAAAPAATSASSSASAAPANLVAAARARTAALFRSYTTQLTVGCARDSCSTPHCKSNPAFSSPASQAEMAKLALELTKTGAAQLCPGITATTAKERG